MNTWTDKAIDDLEAVYISIYSFSAHILKQPKKNRRGQTIERNEIKS